MFIVNQHNPGYDRHNHHVHTNHDKFKCRKPPTQSESTIWWSHGAGRIHFSRILEVRIRPASGPSNMAGNVPLIPPLNHPNKNGQLIVLQSKMAMEIHWNIQLEKLNEHLCDCPLPCLILEDPVAKWLDFCAFLVLSSRLDLDMFILWPAAKASKQTISSTTLERIYQSYIPLKIYCFVSK